MKSLFDTNQSKVALAKFNHRIDSEIPKSDFETQRNSLIRLVVSSMQSIPQQWDELCQVNIDWIGDQFISRLSELDREMSKETLDDICSMCFRFLFELYLSLKNDLAMEFESARRFVFGNLDLFEQSAKEQIEYAIREMPIAIFKSISNSDAIRSIKNFNEVSSKAEKLKKDWEAEISEKEVRVNKLKESLSKYENAFNFVGLYQGFDELSQSKVEEKNSILFWLRMLSVIIVTPIIAELFVIYASLENIDNIKTAVIASFFPILSLVAIAIYYFRVLLFNYRSVKTQLLQIEIRKTLCRFIQHYSEYSSEIKRQDPASLEKFENLIFSGIVSDDGSLPSTYDGLDQISKIIKSAKS